MGVLEKPEVFVEELNWHDDGFWVQKSALLRVDRRGVGSRPWLLRRSDGSVFEEQDPLSDHFEIDGGRTLKPVYDPLRAIVVEQAFALRFDGRATAVRAGDLVIQVPDQGYRVISREEFLRDWDVVGFAGAPKPASLPFERS